MERYRLSVREDLDQVFRDSLLLVVNRSERPQSIMGLKLNLAGGQLLLGEPLGAVSVLRPYGCTLLKFHREIETNP